MKMRTAYKATARAIRHAQWSQGNKCEPYWLTDLVLGSCNKEWSTDDVHVIGPCLMEAREVLAPLEGRYGQFLLERVDWPPPLSDIRYSILYRMIEEVGGQPHLLTKWFHDYVNNRDRKSLLTGLRLIKKLGPRAFMDECNHWPYGFEKSIRE